MIGFPGLVPPDTPPPQVGQMFVGPLYPLGLGKLLVGFAVPAGCVVLLGEFGLGTIIGVTSGDGGMTGGCVVQLKHTKSKMEKGLVGCSFTVSAVVPVNSWQMVKLVPKGEK